MGTPDEVARYSLADVKARTGRNGSAVWIVYRDSVYDLTKYLDEHPAGGDVILEEAGTDATKAFDESAHTPDAKTIMAKYKIGELVEEEKRYDANGKKKKKVVKAEPEENRRSCISIITCGLAG
ncbi:cytochrome b5-like [Ostrinia nubilalis]|uniref:cytochrome b5-like n=1 Tax=Ostrinia furnacalis TaxID=93504 RepID=UPI00103CF693|nr:cytochrome b5-like [Ostrinia furnacalis]XP_028160622.1 cytochrome b5-like [Ostrinia furnacalis]